MSKSTSEIDIYNLTKSLREQRPCVVNKMVKFNVFPETTFMKHKILEELCTSTSGCFGSFVRNGKSI
jgi:hypothetical protein